MAAKTTAKRSYKLDLKTTLEAADRGLRDYYTNLTEEERKGFAPKVLVRWLSSLPDTNPQQQYSIIATNDLVNLGLYRRSNHPELTWLLMTLAGTGRKAYHTWIPTRKSEGRTPLLDEFIREHWPTCNDDEMELLRSLYTQEEWVSLAQESGLTDKAVKDLKNELKKQLGAG